MLYDLFYKAVYKLENFCIILLNKFNIKIFLFRNRFGLVNCLNTEPSLNSHEFLKCIYLTIYRLMNFLNIFLSRNRFDLANRLGTEPLLNSNKFFLCIY